RSALAGSTMGRTSSSGQSPAHTGRQRASVESASQSGGTDSASTHSASMQSGSTSTPPMRNPVTIGFSFSKPPAKLYSIVYPATKSSGPRGSPVGPRHTSGRERSSNTSKPSSPAQIAKKATPTPYCGLPGAGGGRLVTMSSGTSNVSVSPTAIVGASPASASAANCSKHPQ